MSSASGWAETYDFLVEPTDEAYTLFAQSQDRSGFTRGTLAVREGMEATVPELYPRTERGMAAMGMADHGDGGMDHGSMEGMDGMHQDGGGMDGSMHGNGDQPQSRVARFHTARTITAPAPPWWQ